MADEYGQGWRPPNEAEQNAFLLYGQRVSLAAENYTSARYDRNLGILYVRRRGYGALGGGEREIADISASDALRLVGLPPGEIDYAIEHYLHHEPAAARDEADLFAAGELSMSPHSSLVSLAEYRPAEEALTVTFCDGAVVGYEGVGSQLAVSFYRYFSKGRWAHMNLWWRSYAKLAPRQGRGSCPDDPYKKERRRRGRRR